MTQPELFELDPPAKAHPDTYRRLAEWAEFNECPTLARHLRRAVEEAEQRRSNLNDAPDASNDPPNRRNVEDSCL